MHTKSRLSRSIRKYVRWEKAKLRSTITDPKACQEALGKLYSQFQGYNTKKISNSPAIAGPRPGGGQ